MSFLPVLFLPQTFLCFQSEMVGIVSAFLATVLENQDVHYVHILILAFFETPSSLSRSSDVTKPESYTTRYEFKCGIIETIDLICLTIFTFDVFIKSYLIGKTQLFQRPWLLSYYFVIFLSICDCIFSLIMNCDEFVIDEKDYKMFS